MASIDEAFNDLTQLEKMLKGVRTLKDALAHAKAAQALPKDRQAELEQHDARKTQLSADIQQLASEKVAMQRELDDLKQTHHDTVLGFQRDVEQKRQALQQAVDDTANQSRAAIAGHKAAQAQAELDAQAAQAAHARLRVQLENEEAAIRQKLQQAKTEYAQFVQALK